MKKKLLATLFSGALAFGVFGVPGNVAWAAEPGDDCTCHDIGPLSREKRNVAVAGLLSSDVYKAKKAELFSSGYNFKGAAGIEVVVPKVNVLMIGVPFTNPNGLLEIVVFINGEYAGNVPM